MSGSTLEYMRDNCGGREAEYSFDTIVKLAEWHTKGNDREVAKGVGVGFSCGGWS